MTRYEIQLPIFAATRVRIRKIYKRNLSREWNPHYIFSKPIIGKIWMKWTSEYNKEQMCSIMVRINNKDKFFVTTRKDIEILYHSCYENNKDLFKKTYKLN